MIERKILDRVDEHLDASVSLPSRFLHPPSVQINASSASASTSSISDMKRVFHDRTNIILAPMSDVISPRVTPNVYTPNTFGTLNSTINPNRSHKAASICGSSTYSIHRERRYSLAEQALSDTFKTCATERSSTELQILALEQAMAILTARANDSRDRAAKLKICLADRALDPDRYVALQSDRWMEERRQCVADREFRQLSQQVASLKLKRGPSDQRNFDENPLTTPLNNEARRRANLARFFEQSPTRTSFNIPHKCRPLFLDCTFSRRMTMSDVSPLRLRPSSGLSGRFTRKHTRPMSAGGEPSIPTRHSSKPLAPSGTIVPTSLARTIVAHSNSEYPSISFSQSPTLSSRLLPFNDPPDDATSNRPSTPPLSIASTSSNGASHVSRFPSEISPQTPLESGVAMIYASSSVRSHTEILAELEKDSVRVPEYAVNLLEGFDLIHHDFALPEREILPKSKGEETETGLPHPSEESDTGPYTSFALPPFEEGPLWSLTSLNTPSTPRSHVPTLHPLSSGSSTPSGFSTPTATRRPASPSKPQSLLFKLRKRKDVQCSPSSSATNLDGESSRGSKRRFTLFSRK